MRIFRGELRDTIDLLVFGPGERLAAAVIGRGRVDVWNCVTGLLADPWRARDESRRELSVTDIGFLPDERVVACVQGQPLQVFDPNESGHGIVFPAETGGKVLGNAIRVALGSNAVFSTHRHHPVESNPGPSCICWHPVGDGCYTAAWASPAWDFPFRVAASFDGRYAAFVDVVGHHPSEGPTQDYALIMLNAADGTELHRISWSTQPLDWGNRLRFSPDGRKLATTCRDGVFVWDVQSGKPFGEHQPSIPLVECTDLAFHPSGRWLLTSGMDGHVQVWDAETLKPTTSFQWNIGKLRSLAIAADGNIAAAGGEDGNIVVWDLDL